MAPRFLQILIDIGPPECRNATLFWKLKIGIFHALHALHSSPSCSSHIKWSFCIIDYHQSSCYSQATFETVSQHSLEEIASTIDSFIQIPSALTKAQQSDIATVKPKLVWDESNPKGRKDTNLSSEASKSDSQSYLAYLTHNIMKSAKNMEDLWIKENNKETLRAANRPKRNSLPGLPDENVYVIVFSPCPKTIREMIRSIGKPEERLKSLVNPLLSPDDAEVVAKIKLQEHFEVLRDFNKKIAERSLPVTLIWMDTSETMKLALRKSPSNMFLSALLNHYGSWDNLYDSNNIPESNTLHFIDQLRSIKGRYFDLESFVKFSKLLFPNPRLQDTLFTSLNHLTSTRCSVILDEDTIDFHLVEFSATSENSNLSPLTLEGLKFMPSKVVNLNELLDFSWRNKWIVSYPSADKQSLVRWQELCRSLLTASVALVLKCERSLNSLIVFVPHITEIGILLSIPLLSTGDQEPPASVQSCATSTACINCKHILTFDMILLKSIEDHNSLIFQSIGSSNSHENSKPKLNFSDVKFISSLPNDSAPISSSASHTNVLYDKTRIQTDLENLYCLCVYGKSLNSNPTRPVPFPPTASLTSPINKSSMMESYLTTILDSMETSFNTGDVLSLAISDCLLSSDQLRNHYLGTAVNSSHIHEKFVHVMAGNPDDVRLKEYRFQLVLRIRHLKLISFPQLQKLSPKSSADKVQIRLLLESMRFLMELQSIDFVDYFFTIVCDVLLPGLEKFQSFLIKKLEISRSPRGWLNETTQLNDRSNGEPSSLDQSPSRSPCAIVNMLMTHDSDKYVPIAPILSIQEGLSRLKAPAPIHSNSKKRKASYIENETSKRPLTS